MKAYLSGGMEHAPDRGSGWRVSLERWLSDTLSHESFNPVRSSDEFLAAHYPGLDRKRLKKSDPDEFAKFVGRLIDIDLRAIATECDYCICLWDRSARNGAGTQGEITLARYLGKPVYLVSDMPLEKIPGWVLGCSTRTFRSFGQLKRHLRTSYGRTAG